MVRAQVSEDVRLFVRIIGLVTRVEHVPIEDCRSDD
jgi:hypothetical protein